ncbi:transient receptor potential cation channel subfamily V member 3-like [Ornithorhynchus anatinus]|uniref:transient receptor potential cation channel subfamily V member 3-like n=1 Tax=Ornithorhynchus anatinus TaxID=9258 RepID=UPI0019D4921E|nr:transient receptor potential cation channel subfamily V member 3-like [Ornithorhynchus anatinus]
MFLLGFAAALSSLSDKCSAEKSCFYHGLGRAAAELFKLTLGLGDLADPESSSYPDLFRLLLIAYVTLSCILLLNLLIALMTQTINSVSEENEKIWKMQRATTILDLERCLPRSWLRSFQRTRIQSNMFVGWSRSNKEDRRTCLRVNEVGQQNNWTRKVKGIIEDLIPAPTEAPDASTGVEDKDKLDKITSLL